jgi:hypothetical protein
MAPHLRLMRRDARWATFDESRFAQITSTRMTENASPTGINRRSGSDMASDELDF